MTTPIEQWIQELLQMQDGNDQMTEKQARIMQAAIDVFAEKGYAASSTSEIAQRAGVAEGTIFRHYKTKKDLLYSIVGPIMAKLIAPFMLRDFAKVIDVPYNDYEQFLKEIIRNRLEFAKNHLPLIKIFLQEIPFHPELSKHFKKMIHDHVLIRIERVIKHFQAQGQIIPLPPLTVVRLTASTVIGLIISRFIIAPDYGWDEEAEIEATVKFIIRGLSVDKNQS